ncbi:hypothetical protein GCM10020255_022310 [Rhodococcus baikonurensis]
MLTVVHDKDQSNNDNGRSLLDEIVRGAGRCSQPLQAEVAAYIDQFADHLDENGHRLVVRNGYHRTRRPDRRGRGQRESSRVNDKRIDPETGERQRFSSAILPAWVRKSPQMNDPATAVPPWAFHQRLRAALEQFLGSGAGLSPASITRLTTQWQDEANLQDRDLSGTDFVYLWVDGIHLKVRLEQETCS